MVERQVPGKVRRCTCAAEGNRSRVAPEASTGFRGGTGGTEGQGRSVRGWVTEARVWDARYHLGLRGAVTLKAARREIRVRPGRKDPEDARPRVCEGICHLSALATLLSQRNDPCRASSRSEPRGPSHPAAPALLELRSPARTVASAAAAAAATAASAAAAAAAPPRAGRSSRPGRGPGRAAIGQVLTSQRRRRRELGSATRTDILSDQSVVEGARPHGGAALVLRAVSTGYKAAKPGGEACENWNPRKTDRTLDQLTGGIGGATWRGGACSEFAAQRDRSKDWSLEKTGRTLDQ